MTPIPPIPAADLVPQRPPMTMIETLLDIASERKFASCVIHPDNRFLNSDGVLDATVIPELVAQAAAATNTCLNNGNVQPGFLAKGNNIHIYRDIRVNDRLVISAVDDKPLDNWTIITFNINLEDGTPCAEGEIGVCLF